MGSAVLSELCTLMSLPLLSFKKTMSYMANLAHSTILTTTKKTPTKKNNRMTLTTERDNETDILLDNDITTATETLLC